MISTKESDVTARPPAILDSEAFLGASHGFWSGQQQGYLLPFFYGHHNGKDGRKSMSGDACWVRVTKESLYYLSRLDRKVLIHDLPEMAKIVPHGLSMLDVASGDGHAIHNKSLPCALALEVTDTTSLETSPEFCEEALKIFERIFGKENARVLSIDAFQQAQQALCKRAVIYFGGCTVGGILGPVPSAPPIAQLSEMISAIGSHAEEAYIVLSYANNSHNPAQLLRAYNNPPNNDFKRNVLFRMAEELDMHGFNPRLFTSMSFFYASSGCVAHMIIPTAAQTFILDGAKYHVGPDCLIGGTNNWLLHAASSYQYTRQTLRAALELSKMEIQYHSRSGGPVKYVVAFKPASDYELMPHVA